MCLMREKSIWRAKHRAASGRWGPRECQLRSLQKIARLVEGSAFDLQSYGQRGGGVRNGVIHLDVVSVLRSTQD